MDYSFKNLVAKVVEVRGTTVVVAFYNSKSREIEVEFLQLGVAAPLDCQFGDKGYMSYRSSRTSGFWMFTAEKITQ